MVKQPGIVQKEDERGWAEDGPAVTLTHISPLASEILQIWAPDLSEGVSYLLLPPLPLVPSCLLALPGGLSPRSCYGFLPAPFRSELSCHPLTETPLHTQHVSILNIHYPDCPAFFFSIGLIPNGHIYLYTFPKDWYPQELEKFLAHNRCSINICWWINGNKMEPYKKKNIYSRLL